MTEPLQYRLWCAFSDKLSSPFPINYIPGHDTYRDLKKKIRDLGNFDDHDLDDWVLYQPGRPRGINEIFIPERRDQHLASRLIMEPSQSKDRLDIVVVRDDDLPQRRKEKKDIMTAFGRTGLPYRPPAPDILLNSAGCDWDYQESLELVETLNRELLDQYKSYKNSSIDKLTIPLYFFLSGAGTGKSRNAAELHHTAYRCFNGTYPEKIKNNELANRLRDALIFHVSFVNDTGLQIYDIDPWKAIGNRMLLQLLRETNKGEKTTLHNIHNNWNAPTPDEVIDLLVASDGSKLKETTIFLVVDGLHQVPRVFGEGKFSDTLVSLGDFAQEGLRIVCGTSSVTGQIKKAKGYSSSRRTVLLPCTQLLPPTIKQKPIFNDKSILERALVEDCGGHGRALEVLAEFFPEITQHSDTELAQSAVKAYFRQLYLLYPAALPRLEDAIAVIKAAVTNRCLAWDEYVPGTQLTPDDLCQHGLTRFNGKHSTCRITNGRFVMPYISLLLLRDLYPGNEFFNKLPLLDYRDLRAKENLGFGSDFELLMIKIRRMKSHAFSDGQPISLGDLHRGAFINAATKQIQFTNHYLSDEVSIRPFKTKTNILNKYYWKVDTMDSGRINMRKNSHIIRNGPSAPAGDAVLALDSKPARNEVHQYKHVNTASFNFDVECEKAASAGDMIVMFCTFSIPSLKKDGRYYIPRNCILVAKENWDVYFGPHAARACLFAELKE